MSVANTGQELTAETGTYRYMAPEVIRHESYSSNADVYSFGVVLWQLITREIPFATLTPIQTAYAVAEGRRPEIPSDVPDRLRKIIEACLDEDSQRRPSFTYIAMALADYAKMAFHPSNVGAKTVEIANDLLANVSGNCTINIDYTAHSEYTGTRQRTYSSMSSLIASDAVAATTTGHRHNTSFSGSYSNITGSVGLEI
jgi:serine/threonine protein kinase